MRRIILVVLLFLLVSCAPETAVLPTAQSTAVPVLPTATIVMEIVESTAVPTELPLATNEPAASEPTSLPPAEPAPTIAVEEEAEVAVEYGRTEEGAYFQGAADAPVTLIDYSDFL